MMRRFSLSWLVLLALLQLSCTGASAPIVPTTPPGGQTPNAVVPVYQAPDPWSTIRFQNLGIGDGLSQSSVRSILQDRQGFLWLGTEDGLNRYDGANFKIYRPVLNDPTSLSDRWVTCMYEDKDGYLWFGTRQGGVNQYDPRTDTFIQYRHDEKDPSSLAANNVRSIAQDSSGNLWIGTYQGLDRFDPKTKTFQHFLNSPNDPNSLSDNSILSLLVDKKGTLWAGTSSGGLNQYDPTSGAFKRYRYDPKLDNSILGDDIRSIREGPDGSLWLGSMKGLSRLDPQTGLAKRYPIPAGLPDGQEAGSLITLYIDRGGTIWVGTDFGLNWLDQETGKFTNYHHIPALADTLSNNTIMSIFEDREGVLWVGTFGGGVNKYNRSQDKFKYFRHNPENPNSLSSDIVFNFFVDPSRVTWIATQNGLDRFDPATGEFVHFKHDPAQKGSLNDNSTWFVMRDSQGKLWVGTVAGLDQLDESTGQFTHYAHDPQDPTSLADSAVYHIYEDSTAALWIGTGQGLDRFDRQTGKFIHYKDPNNPSGPTKDVVVAIREDSQGMLWVGTFNMGFFRLDLKTEKYTYYLNDPKKADSLSNNLVLAITKDHVGNVWIATDSGLDRYDPASDSFTVYTEQDGMPNDVVYAVVEDKQGFLWLATNFGISRFDPETKSFRNYTAIDGLQGNEFNQGAYGQGADGAIYFGGVNGFNLFYPEQIQNNPYIPPVVLTSLILNGKPAQTEKAVSALEDITLEWPQDSFEFSFAALSFAEPSNNQFAYKLDGFDRDWNKIGNQRNGRYTNLPGGTYTLLLKASNSDGVWNDAGKAIRVTVVAPFWKTVWFYGFIGLVVLGCAVLVYRLRIRGIEKQKLVLERLVNERAQKIEHLFEQNKELAVIEERNRLARDLHDSAKQKAFASLAQLGAASGLINHDAAAAKKHLGEAENLVYEVIQELTFLIQEMYPIALKEKGLSNALREYAFEWETRTDIRVNLLIEGEGSLPLNIEQAVYRIVQESLANVARHSHATQVDFSVAYHQDSVEVSIFDDGQGFDLEQKPNGIGLRSIRERAKSVGGSVDIRSAPGQGTQVTVKVPAQKEEVSNGSQNA